MLPALLRRRRPLAVDSSPPPKRRSKIWRGWLSAGMGRPCSLYERVLDLVGSPTPPSVDMTKEENRVLSASWLAAI